MDLNTRLQHVAVVGAAGKMGSGISLLLALELAWRSLAQPGRTFLLNLIDVNDQALLGLLRYLRAQAVKEAEKQLPRLRQVFADREDLVENGEMIQAFADEVMLHVRTGKTLHLAQDATLVFEAAFERLDIKTDLFTRLREIVPAEAWFLTNTSSIPLHVLEEAGSIRGRLIGYHFYNPPAVQKLLEVVVPEACDPDLKTQALDLAAVLGKTVVVANDVAGFIGNGHFMRDGLHGLREVERLAPAHGFVKALYLVDTVTRDWLLRPMGIFQLIDYVGLDVFQMILRVMEGHLHDGLHSPLIDRFLDLGVKGGQTSSGGQKDGFLKYEGGRPVAAFDPEAQAYVAFEAAWSEELGGRPQAELSWKVLSRDKGAEPKLRAYFQELAGEASLGAGLAQAAFRASRAAGQRLVDQGVARAPQDVNRVLTLGFFHLYGPINDFLD